MFIPDLDGVNSTLHSNYSVSKRFHISILFMVNFCETSTLLTTSWFDKKVSNIFSHSFSIINDSSYRIWNKEVFDYLTIWPNWPNDWTHLNHLASLAKLLSVRLRTRWFWVGVQLQSLKDFLFLSLVRWSCINEFNVMYLISRLTPEKNISWKCSHGN